MQSKKRKKVVIIGAGPGGLSAGMILAGRGHDVTIYEKKDYIGGRNAALKIDGYTFEIGPTFVMLLQAFEDVFKLAGKDIYDYLDLVRLDPLYDLAFADGKVLRVHAESDKRKAEIARCFPGEEKNYDSFMRREKKKFERIFACLKDPYTRLIHYLRWKMFRALPYLDATISVHDVLSKYFSDEHLKLAMSFQSKYLGMSAWECPGTFTILSYIEHTFGVYHPKGGVFKITEAMSNVVKENGGKINLNSGVREIVFDGKVATGIILENGEKIDADVVIMNADFAKGMSDLIKESQRPKYTDARLSKKKYSCSTFMIYLGIDKKYDLPHHKIFFSKEYKKNIDEIFIKKTLPEDPSFYIQNACVTDPSLAPQDHSTLYVLVPVPNQLDSHIDWSVRKQAFRDKIIETIIQKTGFSDLQDHIKVERVICPIDWEEHADVYKGAVFNLAHSLDQMLYFRPHNRLEGYKNLYIVGGGTHPGSGLPTILESGRIAADLVSKDR